jgi:ribonuclease BN (tRNA processing enzyme)
MSGMKIYFYGVQGSASVFPSQKDRLALQELMDVRLLEQVFTDMAKRADPDGRIGCTVQELLGGKINQQNLRSYRKRFDVEDPRIYGGWTTCFRIETDDGCDIVFDLGSGFRNCAVDLQQKWAGRAQRNLFVFGTHSHYDHTEGFDQAAVCFDPRNEIHIYGNRQYLRALDLNLGIFSHQIDAGLLGVQTPLFYELMPAKFRSCEIRDLQRNSPPADGEDRLAHSYHHIEDPVRIGATTITAFEVFHPAPCLAYRIENAGKVFIFCTDHELRHGDKAGDPRQEASLRAEERLKEHARGADAMYRDGQFFRVEYDGYQGIGISGGVPRIDWGHSCIEDVIDMAEDCGIKATYVGHHDPNRDWSERNWIDETFKRKSDQTGLLFELARAETVITL